MSRPTRYYELAAASAVLALVVWSSSFTATGIREVPASLVSFSELMKLGRSLVINRVPEQSRQSLPVPMRVTSDLRIAFMYSPSQAMPNVTRLAPTHFVSLLDPADGTLKDLRPVTPQTFGQTHGPDDMIGTFSLPQGMDYNGYLAARERLFWLYEQLVPVWFADPRAARKDLRPLAAEFLRSFSLLSEPPLAPYYNSLGADFFGWVRAIAR
jgi:hypothetical protein